MQAARPRVALVFGDAAAAAHLREAVAGHVDIVYATSAAEFDAARLAGAGATAALVNLDDCEWLDAVEARLREAGVPVVFNDPEFSSRLEGWDRARWLRHLTAKLGGSADVDPPRPAPPEVLAPATFDARMVPVAAVTESASVHAPLAPTVVAAAPIEADARIEADAPVEPVVAARPWGSMNAPVTTARIVVAAPAVVAAAPAEPEPEPVADSDPHADLALAPEPFATAADAVDGRDVEPHADASAEPEVAATQAVESVPGDAIAPEPGAAFARVDADDAVAEPDAAALDVDTEALSAMIDARLADAEDHAPDESPQVWRVAGDASSSVDAPAPADLEAAAPEPVPAVAPSPAAAAPADDEADILKGMPELGDWQLVDRDEPAAPAAKPAAPEHADIMLGNLAGLELVPMETILPPAAAVARESIENWLLVDKDAKPKPAADGAQPSAAGDQGGDAA